MRRQQTNVSDDALLQRVVKHLKGINFDFSTFSLLGFADWVSARRGMAIHLEPSDDLTRPLGFWFMSDDGAHVRFSSRLPPKLETITVLHELLHIYFGHKTVFVPSLVARLVQYHPGFAARDPLEKDIEDKEAEIGAILLVQQIGASENPATVRSASQQMPDLFSQVVDI